MREGELGARLTLAARNGVDEGVLGRLCHMLAQPASAAQIIDWAAAVDAEEELARSNRLLDAPRSPRPPSAMVVPAPPPPLSSPPPHHRHHHHQRHRQAASHSQQAASHSLKAASHSLKAASPPPSARRKPSDSWSKQPSVLRPTTLPHHSQLTGRARQKIKVHYDVGGLHLEAITLMLPVSTAHRIRSLSHLRSTLNELFYAQRKQVCAAPSMTCIALTAQPLHPKAPSHPPKIYLGLPTASH